MDFPLINLSTSGLSSQTRDAVRDIRLFGSRSRADFDEHSDTDILLILDMENAETFAVMMQEVLSALPAGLDVLTIRGSELHRIFAEGTPFAWHLYLESRSVMAQFGEFFEKLGRPQPYRQVREDVNNFVELLSSVVDNLRDGTLQPIYEAGIAYICLRNIGIAITLSLARKPVFSRWALLDAATALRSPCPISKASLDLLAQARGVGHRGASLTRPVCRNEYLEICSKALAWVGQIKFGHIQESDLCTAS